MLASPGHSPRHILPPPSPSPSIRSLDSSKGHESSLALVSTSGKITGRPPLPKKRKRSQVAIDEDTYVAAIEKIIERDFFPDIPKLQNRLEWLEAVRSGDPVVIRDAQLNIIQRRREKAREQGERDATPASTVAEPFGTPSSMISGVASPSLSLRSGQSPAPSQVLLSQLAPSSPLENEPNVDTSLPLDEFLKRYTSEDNASFCEIIEKVNKQRRQKYKFLSEKELVDPNHWIADEADRITDGFGTSGQPEATLQTWNYRARNLLMYDSAEREDAPLTQAEREELMEGAPKEIAIRNTRFHGKMFDSKLRMEDTVAILYTPVPGSTPTAWPFAERDAERARGRYDLEDLRKTPQVLDDGEMAKASKGAGGSGGYSFVATPSPRPGVDESPFMTWGEIEGTPLRLEAEDTPVGIGGNGKGPHFKIPAPPTRDARAHTLSRDAARSLREKSLMHNPGLSPSPARGASSPAMGSLSAAAQKFVSKAMAKSCATVDARLRASYRASTMPGTPRMARNAVRSREGSVASRESSVPLRSPSIFPS